MKLIAVLFFSLYAMQAPPTKGITLGYKEIKMAELPKENIIRGSQNYDQTMRDNVLSDTTQVSSESFPGC